MLSSSRLFLVPCVCHLLVLVLHFRSKYISLNTGAQRRTYVDVWAGSMSTTKSSWKSFITFSQIHDWNEKSTNANSQYSWREKNMLRFIEIFLSSRLLNNIKYNSGKVFVFNYPVLYMILWATFHFLFVNTILISIGSIQPCCNYCMECSNELAQEDLRLQQEKSNPKSLGQCNHCVNTPNKHIRSQQTYTWARSGCYFTRVLHLLLFHEEFVVLKQDICICCKTNKQTEYLLQ